MKKFFKQIRIITTTAIESFTKLHENYYLTRKLQLAITNEIN